MLRFVAVVLLWSLGGCRGLHRVTFTPPIAVDPTTRVLGTVADSAAHPIPNALVVILRTADTGEEPRRRELHTDSTGQFSAEQAPATYRLTVSAAGFSTLQLDDIDLAASATRDLGAIVLAPAPDEERPTLQEVSFVAGAYTSALHTLVHVAAFDNRSAGEDLRIALSTTAQACDSVTYLESFATCAETPCAVDLPFDLASGPDGERSVFVCVRDKAGLTSAAPSEAAIVLDTLPPPQVLNVAPASRSQGLRVSWPAVVDGGSGVARYVIEHAADASFAAATTVTIDAPLSEALLGPVPVRVSRYVRVRAVDNAGNVGAASAAVSVIVGMTGALIGNVDITEEATLAIDGDDMWLVGPGAGALEVYRCAVASSDCRQSPQWFHVGGVAPSFVPQVDLRGNVAFVAGGRALRMFYRDGDLLTARSCLKTSNCLSAGNWTRSTSYDFSNGYGSGNRVETLATGIGVFAYFTAGEGPSDNSWHLLATRCDRDGDYTGTCTPGIEPLLSITEGQAELGKPVADSTRLWIPFQRPALVLRPHEDCS